MQNARHVSHVLHELHVLHVLHEPQVSHVLHKLHAAHASLIFSNWGICHVLSVSSKTSSTFVKLQLVDSSRTQERIAAQSLHSKTSFKLTLSLH